MHTVDDANAVWDRILRDEGVKALRNIRRELTDVSITLGPGRVSWDTILVAKNAIADAIDQLTEDAR